MTDSAALIKRKTRSFTLAGKTLDHPEIEIEQIINAFSSREDSINLSPGIKLSMKHDGEQVCYILTSGYFSFRQHNTGTIISYIYPPIIVGIGELFTHCSAGYFRTESLTVVKRVTETDFHKALIQNKELWRNITILMAYTTQRLFIRHQQISPKNSYQVVRNLLCDLNLQPDEIRKTIPAARYIIDHASISKSTVMHMLSELQRGNYIVFSKGGYLDIINKLPDRF